MILDNTVKEASQILKKNNINSHELDAELILSHIMGTTREFLITNGHINITEKVRIKFNQAISRRIKREPIPYILGKKEFWSQNFKVNRFTLIPRPESELMIYKVVNFFKNKRINILDIGTGSGCILLSILKELKDSRGIGIDISAKAIKTAVLNSKKLNLQNRSSFKTLDICKLKSGKYDLNFVRAIWHNAYYSLGYLSIDNEDVPVPTDVYSIKKAQEIKPDVIKYSKEYEKILRTEYFKFVTNNPIIFIKIQASKLGVIIFYIIVFLNIGIYLIFSNKFNYQTFAFFIPGILLNSLFGIASEPNYTYLLGLFAYSSLFATKLIEDKYSKF